MVFLVWQEEGLKRSSFSSQGQHDILFPAVVESVSNVLVIVYLWRNIHMWCLSEDPAVLEIQCLLVLVRSLSKHVETIVL